MDRMMQVSNGYMAQGLSILSHASGYSSPVMPFPTLMMQYNSHPDKMNVYAFIAFFLLSSSVYTCLSTMSVSMMPNSKSKILVMGIGIG